MMKKPSAYLPVAMSLVALALVLGAVAFSGGSRDADEGAVAHLWQLLMAGQVPVVLFFGVRWLPLAGWKAVSVLALQVGAALEAMAPVYLLHL